MAKKQQEQKATQPDAPNVEQPAENLSAAEFVKTNTRRHKTRANSTKLLRLHDEAAFVNEFTKQYLDGTIGENDIKILADVKAFLKQLPNNPYNLKDDEANAFVCNDMKHLCIHGEMLNGEQIKLRAVSLSTNRVGYFNPVLANKIIASEKDEDTKTKMTERLEKLNAYPARDGYGSH